MILLPKTIDFIIEEIAEYLGVMIISTNSDEIRFAMIEKLGRGVTVFNGKGGFAKRGEPLRQTNVLYTVITRLELSKLKKEVDRIDPNAFVVFGEVRDIKGGVIKKRPLKK